MPALTPPKLTVRIIKRTLGDHFLDFMNANNPQGFQADEDKEIDETTLSGMLIAVAVMPEIAQTEARERAKLISKASGSKIKKTMARVMVSRALGYGSWTEARAARNEQGIISNLRHVAGQIGKAATDIHSNAKAGVSLDGWTRDKPLPPGFREGSTPEHHAWGWNDGPDAVERKAQARLKPSERIGYVKFRELVDELLASHSPAAKSAGQRLMNWLNDSNRNIIPDRNGLYLVPVFWVEYKGKGMYLEQAALRSLAKQFKKLGGIRGLYHTNPDHFYAQQYARMRAMAEAAESSSE